MPVQPPYRITTPKARKPAVSMTPQPSPVAPLTEAQIQAEAQKRLDAEMTAQRAPILAAQAEAARKALADRQALAGLGQAGAELLKGIAPGLQQGYDTAAHAVTDFAGGFSSETAARVRAAQEANARFVGAQAPGSTSNAPDPQALLDVLYGSGGYISGASLETQGAAARTWGEVLPAIETFKTQNDVAASLGQAYDTNKDYERQLIDLAAKRPDLHAQILDELHKLELDKLNARVSQQQAEIQSRAQDLYEREFGLKQRAQGWQEEFQAAGLALKSKALENTVAAQVRKGAQPSAALSKVYGYMVNADGTPILDGKGGRISVRPSRTSKANTQLTVNRALAAGTAARDQLLSQIETNIPSNKVGTVRQRELRRRLALNYGAAVTRVVQALTSSLKAAGYAAEEIKTQAEQIVSAKFPKP